MKHLLVVSLLTNTTVYSITFALSFIGACCGLVYSYRLYYNVFFDFKKGHKYMYLYLNRVSLKSWLYSSTTLASNAAISLLVAFAYVICACFFLGVLTTYDEMDIFENLKLSNINIYGFSFEDLTKLYAISFLNWAILLIIVMLVLSV